MSKTRFVFFISLLVFLFTGCASYQAEVKPPQGLLFAKFKGPLTANFEHTPNNKDLIKTSHKKTSFFAYVYLMFAWDDADIALIAERAGIKHVAYADYEFLNILSIYGSFQVNVYGYADNVKNILN